MVGTCAHAASVVWFLQCARHRDIYFNYSVDLSAYLTDAKDLPAPQLNDEDNDEVSTEEQNECVTLNLSIRIYIILYIVIYTIYKQAGPIYSILAWVGPIQYKTCKSMDVGLWFYRGDGGYGA